MEDVTGDLTNSIVSCVPNCVLVLIVHLQHLQSLTSAVELMAILNSHPLSFVGSYKSAMNTWKNFRWTSQ